MTQQINGSCGEPAPGVGEGSPGCEGFGRQGFWHVKSRSPGAVRKLVPGAHLMAGPEGSVVESCVPIPSINISSPWDSSSQNPGSKSPFNSRRQSTGKVLLAGG